MKHMTGKERKEVVDSRTLASITEGSVLVFTEQAKLHEVENLQLATLDVYLNGKITESRIKLILPLRLSGSNPFTKGSILVFLGKSYPEVLNNKGNKNWCWDAHTVNSTSMSNASQVAMELSLESLEDLKKRFERKSLDAFNPGTILTLLALKVLTNKDTGEEYGLVKYITDEERPDGTMMESRGQVTFPGRFLPKLCLEDAFPCNVLYEGKKRAAKGGREYHDVHFIDGNDSRITSLLK